ncbi:MAG: hypothetical protein KDA57_00975 [Planctomycetales bacterium]|nr:hypothetical protein [Planctomycetales bacterium]
MGEVLQDEVLQEFVDSHGVSVRVDQAQGVLEGVKLLGLESRNGRRYRETALAKAAPLYEEAKVNVNHPQGSPLAPRKYEERLGVIRQVRMLAGKGLYGNLHFNPKHALAEQLVWDAEHNPRNVGFSHNVTARLSREGEVAVVQEITQVQSVDLVADPATTLGLFEQAVPERAGGGGAVVKLDALTVETLRLHRPDLLEEIESGEIGRLHAELEQARAESAELAHRQHVFELLHEHRLSVAGENKNAEDGAKSLPATVSREFFGMLLRTEADEQVKALIAERAELIQSTAKQDSRHAFGYQPKSWDQLSVFARQPSAIQSVQDFARCLKSSLNLYY